MQPARLLHVFLLLMMLNFPTSASRTPDQFYSQILGKWYLTQSQGGISGELINYHPLPPDSVIINRIPGTDSIRISGYSSSNLFSEKYRVVWSNNYGDWQLSANDREIRIELFPGFLRVYQTENITTYVRIEASVFSGNTDIASAIMQGRWYLTAIGTVSWEMNEFPDSGDSITVIKESDSLRFTYYHHCTAELSDQYHLVIDSSWSLQTDALILNNNSDINRILVYVSDSTMVLKTDSLHGHYLIFTRIDTFSFYKPPYLSSVSGDSACTSADLALEATADPGEIRWYADPEGGNPIANGPVFFPADISETTTFYVDAVYNECVTPARTPVVAVINDTCQAALNIPPDDQKISLFPDPTQGKFIIQLPQYIHPGHILISNEAGIVLKKIQTTGTNQSVSADISEYPAGLYFIIVRDDSSVRVMKIIKQ